MTTLNDIKTYLEAVSAWSFSLDSAASVYNLIRRDYKTNPVDETEEGYTLDFFSETITDIDTLVDYIQDYPGNFRDDETTGLDFNNWTEGTPTAESSGGYIRVTSNGGRGIYTLSEKTPAGIYIGLAVEDKTKSKGHWYLAPADNTNVVASIISISFDPLYGLYLNGDTGNMLISIGHVVNGTTYEVKLLPDFDANTVDVHVDGSEVLSGEAFRNSANDVDYYHMAGWHASNTEYFYTDYFYSTSDVTLVELDLDTPAVVTDVNAAYMDKFDGKHRWRVTWKILN